MGTQAHMGDKAMKETYNSTIPDTQTIMVQPMLRGKDTMVKARRQGPHQVQLQMEIRATRPLMVEMGAHEITIKLRRRMMEREQMFLEGTHQELNRAVEAREFAGNAASL